MKKLLAKRNHCSRIKKYNNPQLTLYYKNTPKYSSFVENFSEIALLAGFFHACNETLVEEPTANDLELKSAQNGLQSYIVVLNDAELDAELSNLKGYEKRKDAAQKAASKVLKRAGIADGQIGHAYGTAIKGFSVKIPPGQLKKLENDPAVKYVEEDKVISLGKPGTEDVVIAAAQEVPWGITRVKGGVTYSGSNRAWIVDSGIDLDHPDLNVNESLSKSFIVSRKPTSADDEHGHGTHVAGTVAAIDNDLGVIGVAAGAEVISCRVLDRTGSGSFSWTVAALDYIASEGTAGDVVNMSLGPSVRYTDDAVDAAVQSVASLGIKLSIAAGNESDDCLYYSPAHNNGTNIHTISAMDINNTFAYFSNYGSPVDYCEPGVSIYSTYKNGGYATMSGTSMAAPHMAGILVWGSPATDGTVSGDPDGDADPIGVVGGGNNSTNDAPIASFTYSTINLSVDFTDTSIDDDTITWNWNFGDGTTSNEQNPNHTYATGGTYTVTLNVTDNYGQTDAISQSVTVSDNTGSEILLDGEITGNKVKKVTLTWTGATGATVTLHINNEPIVVTNSGSYIENLGKITGGTFEYYIVDEAGVESNLLDLSF